MKLFRILRIFLALSILIPGTVAATPFNQIIVLGDSLSDSNGNLMAAAGTPIPASAAYASGHFSNGPLWIEYLAANLGLPVDNLAVSGAYSGSIDGSKNFLDLFVPGSRLPGLSGQVDQLVAHGQANPDALYVIWAAVNNFLVFPNAANIGATVNDIVGSIKIVANLGAQSIIIPGMPNLGITPSGLSTPDPFSLTALSLGFNSALNTALLELESVLGPGVDLIPLDIFGIQAQIFNNPLSFGLTNVTQPCAVPSTSPTEFTPTVLISEVNVCANPEQYLYWDEIHPTTRTHQILSDAFLVAIIAEPATLSIFFLGFVIMNIFGRRNRLHAT